MSKEEFEAGIGVGRTDRLKEIESATDSTVAEEKTRLMGLIEALHARGMTNVVFDPEIVRGFDYYTGMVFEVFDTNPENARSMFGGGRYDNLVGMFGGDPIPCVGCAVGDVTLMDFLETHGLTPAVSSAPEVFIGTPSETSFFAAQTFAQTLRAAGVRTLVNGNTKSLGDQIRDASRRGIKHFIAYGDEESSSSTVRLKTLATSTDEEVSQTEVAQRIISAR